MQTLDATIVNVALPTIEGNIGASIDDGTWIITGYIISNVIAIPLAPYFFQRFGRRQYYATCIVGFTIASVLCGTATTLPAMIAFRVIQGAFGGRIDLDVAADPTRYVPAGQSRCEQRGSSRSP